MVTYTKQPTSIAEQIAMLKQRGLLIENDDYAFEKLNVISYFRLACYWHPLEENKFLHIFKPNSYFNDVIVIYEFDKELRNLLFSSIQSIEIAFRTKIIQFLSSEYGAFGLLTAMYLRIRQFLLIVLVIFKKKSNALRKTF